MWISGTNRMQGLYNQMIISVVGALSLALINISSLHLRDGADCLLHPIALGFSLQQTATQPFAIALGSPETGVSAHIDGVNSFNFYLCFGRGILFGKATTDKEATIPVILKPSISSGLFTLAPLIFEGVSNFRVTE